MFDQKPTAFHLRKFDMWDRCSSTTPTQDQKPSADGLDIAELRCTCPPKCEPCKAREAARHIRALTHPTEDKA